MSTERTLFSNHYGIDAADRAESTLNAGKRGCYRCADCLSVFFVDNPQRWKQLACGACDGRAEWLGFVGVKRLYNTGTDSACDFRCTSARGPSCDCHCKGENHGSRATVVVVFDAGPIPRATPPNAAQARLAAETFRKERDAAAARLDARYKDVMEAKSAGAYLDAARFRVWLDSRSAYLAFHKAARGKTNARIKALQAIGREAAEMAPRGN